nr:hypothetical protein [Rubinisphaera italica]
MNHGFASWHRRVELLSKRNDINIVISEHFPEIDEVLEASRDPVKFETNHNVDVSGDNIPLESFQLRTVLIFRGLTGVNIKLDSIDIPAFTTDAEVDFLLNFVLLSDKAIALRGLTLGGNADVPGDPACCRSLFSIL